jgi:hypothetical protein
MAAAPRLDRVSIEQQRRLVTALPGPRPEELTARKISAVGATVHRAVELVRSGSSEADPRLARYVAKAAHDQGVIAVDFGEIR